MDVAIATTGGPFHRSKVGSCRIKDGFPKGGSASLIPDESAKDIATPLKAGSNRSADRLLSGANIYSANNFPGLVKAGELGLQSPGYHHCPECPAEVVFPSLCPIGRFGIPFELRHGRHLRDLQDVSQRVLPVEVGLVEFLVACNLGPALKPAGFVMEIPTLLVLAAGMGSRYGGLKQIDPMGPSGETILDYSIWDAIQAGFRKVVFVIREEFERDFRESIGNRIAGRIEVDYAFQSIDDLPAGFDVPPAREKPWGTAHAVYSARQVISAPFAVINADDFYGRDAYRQSYDFLFPESVGNRDSSSCCLVAYSLINTLSDHGGVNRGITSQTVDQHLEVVEEVTGIVRNERGEIKGTALDGTERVLSEDASASMNFWGFSPLIFDQLEGQFLQFLSSCENLTTAEWHIPTLIDLLLQTGEASCQVIPTGGSWFGVTHREDKPKVMNAIGNLVAQGEYGSPLWV